MTKPSNFDSDNHALISGMVMGLLLEAGVDVVPEMDADGDHTPRMTIRNNKTMGYVGVNAVTITVESTGL